MVAFVIVAVFFTLVGFLLGFFLTSAAAQKNQGQMKCCQSCHYLKDYVPYDPCDPDFPDSFCAGMTDSQYEAFLQKMQEEG